jgi:hypothetical protein
MVAAPSIAPAPIMAPRWRFIHEAAPVIHCPSLVCTPMAQIRCAHLLKLWVIAHGTKIFQQLLQYSCSILLAGLHTTLPSSVRVGKQAADWNALLARPAFSSQQQPFWS